MKNKMLQFVELKKETPLKRKVSNRNTDFNEIYNEFINTKAKEQSSRCSQCGVPFCQIHCPLSNNIPDWLKLTAEGRLEEAYELSQSTNNMPEVCGRICPQDRLCEGNCVIEQSGHGTVTIGSIEKHITDVHFLQKAIGHGRRSIGITWPNPPVGCVIVKKNKIVGRGSTGENGIPHAEINALNQAGENSNDSDNSNPRPQSNS